LGVTLWEIVNDGKSPVRMGRPEFGKLEELDESNEGWQLVNAMQKCLLDDSERRPTLEEVFEELGGIDCCGCKSRKAK
jgi:hypothetical protein